MPCTIEAWWNFRVTPRNFSSSFLLKWSNIRASTILVAKFSEYCKQNKIIIWIILKLIYRAVIRFHVCFMTLGPKDEHALCIVSLLQVSLTSALWHLQVLSMILLVFILNKMITKILNRYFGNCIHIHCIIL